MRSPCAVLCAFLLAGNGMGQAPSFDGADAGGAERVVGRRALAQQRLATAGRVLDAAGQPLLAATVTFVGSEPPVGDRFANADRVVVISDDKGRFRAELLTGSDYSCWAADPAGQDGSRKVSEVAEGVRAGTGIELRAPHSRRSSRLLVSGTEPWQHVGPLRFEIAVAVAHVHRQPLVFVDGAAPLPSLPIGTAWLLFVVDGAGHLLHGQRLESQPGDVRCGVPPPRDIPVRVVDALGAPVAGATMRARIADAVWCDRDSRLTGKRPYAEWRDVGTTGADGTAVVQVPCREDPFAGTDAGEPMLLACKLDHAAALGGWNNGRAIVDGQWPAKLERAELPFTLHPAPSWRGRILASDGVPLAGATVHLAASLPIRMASRSLMRNPTAFRTRTAADGTFVFDGLPAELQDATLLVETGTLPEPAANRRSPPFVHAPALQPPALDRPFGLDLHTLPTLGLKVRDVTGGPARNADVFLLPVGKRQPDHATHAFQLDGSGTARTRVQPGRWWLFVTDRVGFLHMSLEVTHTTELELDLQMLAVMRGRVRVDGRPPRGAVQIRLNGSSTHSQLDEATVALGTLSIKANQWLAALTTVATDGSFELPFLDVQGASHSGFVIGEDGQAELRVRPSEDPIEFDLRKK